MADIEIRVTALEQEMASLKAKVVVIDEDMQNIPNLIKTESRFLSSQISRVSNEMGEVRRDMADMKRELTAKVDALPRIVAEIVQEMLAKKR